MKRLYQRGGTTIPLEVEPADEDGAYTIRLPEGSEHPVRARRLPGGDIEIREGHRVFRVPTVRGENGAIWLAWEGETLLFTPTDGSDGVRPDKAAGGPRSGLLGAPMVGVVADVLVAEGDRVAAYQPVAIVEAMKVFATVEAPFDGTVQKVYVHIGDRIEHDAPMVEIAPDDESGEK